MHSPASAAAAVALVLAFAPALASPPSVNALGFEYSVVTAGVPATVEVRLHPQKDFASARLEAGSGVTQLVPACSFAALAAGEHYSCRVSVTGNASTAAMALAVVARRAAAGRAIAETEVHHLAVRNAAFVPSARSQAASTHVLSASAATTPAKR